MFEIGSSPGNSEVKALSNLLRKASCTDPEESGRLKGGMVAVVPNMFEGQFGGIACNDVSGKIASIILDVHLFPKFTHADGYPFGGNEHSRK